MHKVGAGFLPAVWLEDMGFISVWAYACQKLSSRAAPSHEDWGCACVSAVHRIQSDNKKVKGRKNEKKHLKRRAKKKKKKTDCSLLSISSCCSLSCAVRAPFWQVLRLGSEVSAGLGWEPTLPLLTAAMFSHRTVTSALWLLKNV